MTRSRTRSAIVGALAALALAAPALARPGDPTEVEKLRKQADGIAKEVEQIRHLPLKRPVEKGILDRDELRKFILDEFQKEMPPEKAKAIEKSYVKIGFLKPGTDLLKTEVDLYTEQVAAFYNPETKQLYMIEHGGPDQEVIMAHELTHALQDQSFDLQKLQKSIDDNDDRSLALTSLIEGDATVSMIAYLLHHQGANIDVSSLPDIGMLLGMTNQLGSMMGGDDGQKKMKAAPKILSQNMLFGYMSGASFCQKLIKKGGSYDAVSKAFGDRPQSSEQIMHPEKFTGAVRDEPIQVTMPDLSTVMGNGWTLLMKNVMGEYDTGLLFKEKLGGRESDRAAAGWGGDSWQTLEGPGGEVVFCWYTTWDTEKDAQEFNDTYQKFHDAKNDGSALKMVMDGKTVVVVDGGGEAVRKTLLQAMTSKTTTKVGYDETPVATADAGGDSTPQADAGAQGQGPDVAAVTAKLQAPEGWTKHDTAREGVLAFYAGPNGEALVAHQASAVSGSLQDEMARRKAAIEQHGEVSGYKIAYGVTTPESGTTFADAVYTIHGQRRTARVRERVWMQGGNVVSLSLRAPVEGFDAALAAVIAANPNLARTLGMDVFGGAAPARKKEPTLY